MISKTRFDNDYGLSLKAQQYQNGIYRQLFNIQDNYIRRFIFDDKNILNVDYHIDVELTLNNRSKLLGQEKALRYEFAYFNTFTIEFYQNRFTKEKGEFFNLGAQFYLHSYWNVTETGFCKWYLIKIFDFLDWLKLFPTNELEKHTRLSEGSRASFYWINYNEIPTQFIHANYKQLIIN